MADTQELVDNSEVTVENRTESAEVIDNVAQQELASPNNNTPFSAVDSSSNSQHEKCDNEPSTVTAAGEGTQKVDKTKMDVETSSPAASPRGDAKETNVDDVTRAVDDADRKRNTSSGSDATGGSGKPSGDGASAAASKKMASPRSAHQAPAALKTSPVKG